MVLVEGQLLLRLGEIATFPRKAAEVLALCLKKPPETNTTLCHAGSTNFVRKAASEFLKKTKFLDEKQLLRVKTK